MKGLSLGILVASLLFGLTSLASTDVITDWNDRPDDIIRKVRASK